MKMGRKKFSTVCSERWEEAHAQREELMGSITKWSGVGTLEDFRRYRDYDADKLVDQYLNQPAVKVSMLPLDSKRSEPASIFLSARDRE